MNSRIRHHSCVHLALVLLMFMAVILIILSTTSKLTYAQQKELTNTSTILNKTGSPNGVLRPLSNITAKVPTSLSNATMAKIGDATIHLPTEPEIPVYIVSSIGTPTFHYVSDFSNLYRECPEEVAILVHGRSKTEASPSIALEEFDRAAISIERNHYYFPIIGFLWPTSVGVDKISAYINQTINAPLAGNELAGFLTDFKTHCKDTNIRIAAHSMGTAVVFNALVTLSKNPGWTANKYKIESIHFLGSSLMPEDPDKNKPFGGFVQNFVGNLHNLYSPADDILSKIGFFLGNTGASDKITTPTNYKDVDVAKEIVNPATKEENHLAYWGVRDEHNHVIDDGAMNVVVSDWLKPSSSYGEIFDLPTSSSSPSNATIIPH